MAIRFNKNNGRVRSRSVAFGLTTDGSSWWVLSSIVVGVCLGMIGCNKGQHKIQEKMTDGKYLSDRCAQGTNVTNPPFDLNKYIAERNAKLNNSGATILTYMEDMTTTNAGRVLKPAQNSQSTDFASMDFATLDFMSQPIGNNMGTKVSPLESTTTIGHLIHLDKINCETMASVYRGPGAPEGVNVKVTAISTWKVKFDEVPQDKNSDVVRKFEISAEYPDPKAEKRETIDMLQRKAIGVQDLTIKVTKVFGKAKETQAFVVKQSSSYKDIEKFQVKPSVANALLSLAEFKLATSSAASFSEVDFVSKFQSELQRSKTDLKKLKKVSISVSILDAIRKSYEVDSSESAAGLVTAARLINESIYSSANQNGKATDSAGHDSASGTLGATSISAKPVEVNQLPNSENYPIPQVQHLELHRLGIQSWPSIYSAEPFLPIYFRDLTQQIFTP